MCVFWFASLKFKSHIIIFFVEIFFPCLIILLDAFYNASFVLRSALTCSWPTIQIVTSKTEPNRRWSNFSKLRRALGDGNDCRKGLLGKDRGHWTAQISWAKSWKLCFSNKVISIPNDLMELLIEDNQHSPPFFISESLSYQPKQCTIKSKSLEMSVDVPSSLIPPIWFPFHNPCHIPVLWTSLGSRIQKSLREAEKLTKRPKRKLDPLPTKLPRTPRQQLKKWIFRETLHFWYRMICYRYCTTLFLPNPLLFFVDLRSLEQRLKARISPCNSFFQHTVEGNQKSQGYPTTGLGWC